MIVIDSGLTSHVISIIPRTYDTSNAHTFALTDDDHRTTTNVTHTKSASDGYLRYTITLTTSEGKGYGLKITDNATTEVVWRGKIFATTQTTQNYRINE